MNDAINQWNRQWISQNPSTNEWMNWMSCKNQHWINERVSCKNMKYELNGWINKWMKVGMNYCMMNKWINELMNERIN